jgi:hypothetical protein
MTSQSNQRNGVKLGVLDQGQITFSQQLRDISYEKKAQCAFRNLSDAGVSEGDLKMPGLIA